jgi:hypothetical protein
MCSAGGSISELTVTCKDVYSRVIGLIRLGEQLSSKDALYV